MNRTPVTSGSVDEKSEATTNLKMTYVFGDKYDDTLKHNQHA